MQEIIEAIKASIKEIAQAIKYADLGYTKNQNSTGDTQLKLDIISDKIIEQNLSKVQSIKAIISEEKNSSEILNENGSYIVAYDPLDGSSLVDVNFAVGSIFAIYKDKPQSKNLISAIYCIYGPRLELVIALQGQKPELYRLDADNEFKFIKHLTLGQKGKINATGATQKGWSNSHASFIRSLFEEGYRLRYSGAMVADLHQILLKGGGLFSYPATTDAPNGKLRLLFEILPFALIFKEAGGEAVSGKMEPLLNIEISSLHQSSPCYFGSIYEINALKDSINAK